jgi:hypothetical protein
LAELKTRRSEASSGPAAGGGLGIRPLREEDVGPVLQLWAATEGLGRGSADAPGDVARFVRRNPGLSVVAEEGGRVVALRFWKNVRARARDNLVMHSLPT